MGNAKTVLLSVGLLLVPVAAGAETIVLKSGKVVSGTILSLPSTMVELLTPEGRILIPRDDVLAISYASAPLPSPSGAGTPPVAAGTPSGTSDVRAADVASPVPVPEREDPLKPFLDKGSVGGKLLINPYTTLRAHASSWSKVQGNVPFSGGFGGFAEYMSRYVGVGLEVDVEMLRATTVWEQASSGSGQWTERTAKGNEGRLGTVIHVWPYLKVRIPTKVVDPYFLLHFGYANYSGSFKGSGPFDGVAICPRVGVAWKVSKTFALTGDVGYNFAHFESRNPNDDNNVEIHNLQLNVGFQYRF
jgi:hypothetical protein